jgi:hemerythrin-like domain-containing protein
MKPTTAQTDVVDTDDMVLVHTFLRREFRLASGVLRQVRDGDTGRAARVADHLDFLDRFLLHHHTIEDELLWPLLLTRVPEELAPIVHLMEAQHAGVEGALATIGDLLPRWCETAAADLRDTLAKQYDALYVALAEHLDAEEQRLLPIAARALSQAEWDALGEEGRRRGNRRKGPLVLGMFAYEGDPAVFQRMLGDAPWPARILLPRLGRRTFRKHALLIHGTTTP